MSAEREVCFTMHGRERIRAMFSILEELVNTEPFPTEQLKTAINMYAEQVSRMDAVILTGSAEPTRMSDDFVMNPDK